MPRRLAALLLLATALTGCGARTGTAPAAAHAASAIPDAHCTDVRGTAMKHLTIADEIIKRIGADPRGDSLFDTKHERPRAQAEGQIGLRMVVDSPECFNAEERASAETALARYR